MAQVERLPPEIIFDEWTALSYKHVLNRRYAPGISWMAPLWTGDHQRRLQAYKILLAYRDNVSRHFTNTTDQETIDNKREYGDAALIVQTIVDSLLGDDQKIFVDGQEKEDARAVELQEYLVEWSKDEKFALIVEEAEEDAVALGDAVFVLGWSNEKKRPRITIYDPGFYFPVLDTQIGMDYPFRIHIAWEEEDDKRLDGKVRVHRITYELADIRPLLDEEFQELLDVDGNPVLRPGDSIGVDGFIERQLPWNDEPSTKTCYLTEAVWIVEGTARNVDDFSMGKAIYEVNAEGQIMRDLDMGIDFIPVVHLPNTTARKSHFGRSSLSYVLQVLDDLVAADTDLQAAAATTGSPVLALKGAQLDNVQDGKLKTYGPGTVFETGDGGMDILDTSRGLDALIKYVESLLSRLATNSRIPESVLGRVKPSEVPSGIALALSFGPLEAMVRKMRQVRDDKYPTLLKFILRFALLGEAISAGELPEAKIEFGSFLPSDQTTAVQTVTTLIQDPQTISMQTALQILVEAGIPIDDIGQELARIEEEKAAKQAMALEQAEAEAKIMAANAPPGQGGKPPGPGKSPQTSQKGAPTRTPPKPK